MTRGDGKALGTTGSETLSRLPPFESVVGGDAARVVAAFPMVVFDTLGHYLRSSGTSNERRTAFNHLVNDVLAVSDEVTSYAGRSAARSARSVFENCVNLADVMSSDKLAARYAAHEHVITYLLAEHQSGVDLMTEGEGNSEKRRLNRARRNSREDCDRAIAAYGRGFRRQWSPQNLHDRSRALGWEDGYRGYKILSAVIHGSSGGTIGTRQETEYGPSFRVGPAIELIPIALLEATRAVIRLLDHAEANWRGFDGTAARHVADEVLLHWRKMRIRLLELDRTIWPEVPAPDPATVLAFYDNGERWYWHDPLHDIVAVADPPNEEEMTPQQRDALTHLRALRLGTRSDGRPHTVMMIGHHVLPRANARYANAAAVLGGTPIPASTLIDAPNLEQREHAPDCRA